MKRIKEACICQTLHFMLSENVEHNLAVKFVKDEVEKYKSSLAKNNTKYKIVEETTQPDGSVIMKIKKQYNKINRPMSFRAKRGIFERFFVTSFLRMTKGNFQ